MPMMGFGPNFGAALGRAAQKARAAKPQPQPAAPTKQPVAMPARADQIPGRAQTMPKFFGGVK